MKRAGVIFCAVLSVALAAEEVEIPRNLKLCNKQSEDYDDCLRDAIEDAIGKFVKGYPQLDIPVLDPYLTPYHSAEMHNNFFTGKMYVKNANTYGISRAQILNVRSTVSDDSQRLEVTVQFPRIFIEGEYKTEGSAGDFKIGGKGFFNVSMEGVKTVWDMSGPIQNDRWVVEHFRMLPEVEKMKVYFDDLFNGNEAINHAARTFINEYWPLFYRAMLPATASEWDKRMTEFVNRVFSRLSYSKLFA